MAQRTMKSSSIVASALVMLVCSSCANQRTAMHKDPFLEMESKSTIQQVAHTDAAATVATASANVPFCEPAPHCPPNAACQQCPPLTNCPPSGASCPLPYPNAAGAGYCLPSGVPVVPHGTRVFGPNLGMGGPFRPQHYPDEYLCDGGDRGYPVHYDDLNRLGLETEDTVAEYVDHTGEFHMKPSTKVCVYSPRFAALSTIDNPFEDVTVVEAVGGDQYTAPIGVSENAIVSAQKKYGALGGVHVRTRPSGLERTVGPGRYHRYLAATRHHRFLQGHQAIRFLATGLLDGAQRPFLARGVKAAAVWTQTQFPVIAAKTIAGQEVRANAEAAQTVAVEDNRRPGRLRIIKLADKETAQIGDEITFTLRYDNLGERELHHIRIVDNLTPRLEFIPDSETSDRDGDLIVQDNEEGSVVLEFKLDKPLPAKEGGVITFKTRVR